ncbi:MAG: hypothetical protein JSU63_05220 [Phycisphaerales bacterium]|nr:MAG: hypothetical protein JSU63_05220 [Phycisphaerales bacterium]
MSNPDNKSCVTKCSDEEHDAVMKDVYEYARSIREEQSAFYGVYLQKIHRLMTVQILLFAGMSYASSQAGWAKGGHMWALGGIGILGALLLFVGFVCCIRCLGIEDVSVLGIKRLDSAIKERKTERIRPADVRGQLSQNILQVIREDRKREDNRKRCGKVVNCTTISGSFFVAAFVLYAIVGNAIFERNPLTERNMSDQQNGSNNSSGDQSGGQDSKPSDAPQDRPSLVEPSETSQRDAGPSQPKVAESTHTVPVSRNCIPPLDPNRQA